MDVLARSVRPMPVHARQQRSTCRIPRPRLPSRIKALRVLLSQRHGVARPAMFFDDLVVMARGETPDPIPNSAVKTLSADGTAS